MHQEILPLILLSSMSVGLYADEAVPYLWENSVTLESITNLQGGVKEGTRNLANLDVTLTVDTAAANWWNSGTLFVYVLGDYGKNPSDLTGDIQGISNIAAPVNDLKLYEFWYQHHFFDDNIKWLVGLHDYNSVFNSLESAGLFTSSSFGIGSDISQIGLSIFPVTSLGSVVQFQSDSLFASLAVYDGIPGDPDHTHGTHIRLNKGDGLFKALEVGLSEEGHYKLAVGAWELTAEAENPVDAEIIDHNNGIYMIGETYFTEHFSAFFQFGRADTDSNQIDQYIGAGIQLTNTLLDDDALGLGYSRARNGSSFLTYNTELESTETIVELTYLSPLTEKIALQTSVYSIQNPSMDTTLDNALALGVRAYITF